MPSQVDQEKYEAVRSAVIAACPDLSNPRNWVFTSVDFVTYEGKHLFVPPSFMFWLEELPKINARIGTIEEKYEKGERQIIITEHVEIQLSHVLRAIPHIKPFVRGNAESMGNANFVTAIEKWNLTKSFEDQKPEVYSFLYDVLCQNQSENLLLN